MRWPLDDCGNGQHNKTAFEECDFARKPPAYDYNYRETSDVWYWSIKDGGDNNYYMCTDLCLKTPIYLCGDGVQSNGPENNDQREAGDDRNKVSGDGCSADCKTIEPGYECPIWGQPCRKLCGNGVLDPPYNRTNPFTGV